MTLYQLIPAFCNEVAVTWRKTQRINLALAMQAGLVRRSLTLSHLAQPLPVAAQGGRPPTQPVASAQAAPTLSGQ